VGSNRVKEDCKARSEAKGVKLWAGTACKTLNETLDKLQGRKRRKRREGAGEKKGAPKYPLPREGANLTHMTNEHVYSSLWKDLEGRGLAAGSPLPGAWC
jgi:hypothetical protein